MRVPVAAGAASDVSSRCAVSLAAVRLRAYEAGGGMRRAWKQLALCAVACVAATVVVAAGLWTGSTVSAADVGPLPAGASSSASLRLTPFASTSLPSGAEQASAVENAERSSAGAFVARWRSRLQFTHLTAAAAQRTAAQAFPDLVDRPDGGAPALPAGERLRRYSATNVAQVSLANHARGVIESNQPMATRSASGRLEPIDLALKPDGSSFAPVSPGVGVQIPRRAQDGVRASSTGVSLTASNARGEALDGSEGALVGASVLYANTQTDTDTMAKPTSSGFEMSTILRSEDSPHELYYRVGLPAGARLVQHRPGAPVQIVSATQPLGLLMPPVAVDAAGVSVPVRMSVTGDMLRLDVHEQPGEYQYPLAVDPEYTAQDRSLTGSVWPSEVFKVGAAWVPYYSSGFTEEHTYKKSYSCELSDDTWCDQSWYIEPAREYNEAEFAGLQYRTQGESAIYNVEMWVEGYNEPSQTTTKLEYRGPSEELGEVKVLSGGEKQELYKDEPLSLPSGSTPLKTPHHNAVRLVDYTTKHESQYGFWTDIKQAQVDVVQEESKHPEESPTSACPECGFNTTAPSPKRNPSRTNILYTGDNWSQSWLSPTQGAFEVTSHDPGIGVSREYVAELGGGEGWRVEAPIYKQGDFEGLECEGIQCPETYETSITWSPAMGNGEDTIELYAEDAAALYGYSEDHIKVEAAPPEELGFTGMPEVGAEVSAAPHVLTLHASDGKGQTISPGVASMDVSLNGGPQTAVSASCSPGPCTATGQYTLDAEAVKEGVNTLTISAVDYAGNVSPAKEFSFDVRHAAPQSAGPGAVDPTTGQFTLGSTDVSLGAAAQVQRSYASRAASVGAGGPLGPQWAMSVGGGEGLQLLPSGEAVLTSSTGGTTTFSPNSKGELESPKGDESLKLQYKSSEHKYVLTDAGAGAETVFEQPAGTQSTPPRYGSSFGAESDLLSGPITDALDANGDLWVTDWNDNRVAEFSKTGGFIGAHGTEGSAAGQFHAPWGIVVSPSSGNVYVSDLGNDRIVKLSSSGAFEEAWGWGVKDGKAESETCTTTCEVGIAGDGGGQLNSPHGLALDSSGDVWVADCDNDRVEEFSSTGTFLHQIGSGGSGAGEMSCPAGIAFSGGNMFVADYGNNRIDEFNEKGETFIGAFGFGVGTKGEEKLESCTTSCKAGIAGPTDGQLNGPNEVTTDPVTGNLYVADKNNERVQEFSTTGTFIATFGSKGSGEGQFEPNGPQGIAVSSAGTLYVTDTTDHRVEMWSRGTWWGIWQEAEPAHRARRSVEGAERLVEPAQRAGGRPAEHDAAPPRAPQDRVEAVCAPRAEHADDVAAADVD
jgi:DNA-binding beta-propeller fold protein YncE